MSGGGWVSRGVGGSESGGERESEERRGGLFKGFEFLVQ